MSITGLEIEAGAGRRPLDGRAFGFGAWDMAISRSRTGWPTGAWELGFDPWGVQLSRNRGWVLRRHGGGHALLECGGC